jgi:hypothetical protein
MMSSHKWLLNASRSIPPNVQLANLTSMLIEWPGLKSYPELAEKLLLRFMPPVLLLLTILASSHLGIWVYIQFWDRSRYETDDCCSWQGNLTGPLSHNKNWYFSYSEMREGKGVWKNFKLVSNLKLLAYI